LSDRLQRIDASGNTIGGLAEDQREGTMVGELVSRVLSEQFVALRDGDRF